MTTVREYSHARGTPPPPARWLIDAALTADHWCRTPGCLHRAERRDSRTRSPYCPEHREEAP